MKANLLRCKFLPIELLRFEKDGVPSFLFNKSQDFVSIGDYSETHYVFIKADAVCDLKTEDKDYKFGVIYPQSEMSEGVESFTAEAFVFQGEVEINVN